MIFMFSSEGRQLLIAVGWRQWRMGKPRRQAAIIYYRVGGKGGHQRLPEAEGEPINGQLHSTQPFAELVSCCPAARV